MYLARSEKSFGVAMTIDPREFRRVLGAFTTGVAIVTSQRDGSPAGFTANAFTSVSLDPPLVLICAGNQNTTLGTIQASQAFAVNIMPVEAEALARCFATNGPEKYQRFCDAPWHSETTGSPVLDAALAWVDCRLYASYPGGDHQIMVGEVLALGMRPGTPLLFSAGTYLPMPTPKRR